MSETNKNAFQAGQAAGKAERRRAMFCWTRPRMLLLQLELPRNRAGKSISDAAVGGVNFVKDKTGLNK
nr:kin2 [Arabidopsis thaliana]